MKTKEKITVPQLLTITGLILITLKVLGIIEWHWLIIVSPLIISFFTVIMALIAIIVAFFVVVVKKILGKKL